MKKPVLVILAAGMGSRYGGLKQIDPVDEEGNKIIDFSMYDAKRAGFEEVVFIIKKEIEKDFVEQVGSKVSKYMKVNYVFQELDKLPDGYNVPDGRKKPWGTGHALLCCKDVIDSPFAIINADDYYGPNGFKVVYDFLTSLSEDRTKMHYAMVGYRLVNTLSKNGSVARGVCVTKDGFLQDIDEIKKIVESKNGGAYEKEDGSLVELPSDTLVSMNFWGFTPDIFKELENKFVEFLNKGLTLTDEFYIPLFVGELIKENKADVKVLETLDKWFGVTYKEDKPGVVASIKELKNKGVYPNVLWK